MTITYRCDRCSAQIPDYVRIAADRFLHIWTVGGDEVHLCEGCHALVAELIGYDLAETDDSTAPHADARSRVAGAPGGHADDPGGRGEPGRGTAGSAGSGHGLDALRAAIDRERGVGDA